MCYWKTVDQKGTGRNIGAEFKKNANHQKTSVAGDAGGVGGSGAVDMGHGQPGAGADHHAT